MCHDPQTSPYRRQIARGMIFFFSKNYKTSGEQNGWFIFSSNKLSYITTQFETEVPLSNM